MEFLGLGGRGPLMILKIAALAMVVWGAVQPVSTVFNFADASMAVMATINLIAIVILSGTVRQLTVDYFRQRKAGKEPLFRFSEHPNLDKGIDPTIWNRDVEAELV